MDLHITHEHFGSSYFGSSFDPSINGYLQYPNDSDRSLNETVGDNVISFMTVLPEHDRDQFQYLSVELSSHLKSKVRNMDTIEHWCNTYTF